MAVLMIQESSGGKRRQCNASCHNAKHPKCVCICGGRFHGGARDGTLEQRIKKVQEEIIDMAIKELQQDGRLSLKVS